MKKKLQDSIIGQMLCVLLQHIKLAFIFAIFSVMLLPIWSHKAGEVIFAAIGVLFYSASMYGIAGTIFDRDKKSYTPLTPKPWKGLILPAILTIANIAAIVIYKCAWAFGNTGGTWTSGWGIAGNIFTFAWFSMYQPFMGIKNGVITAQGYAIVFALPIIMTSLGYFLTYNGVYVSKYINSIKYEKKK